MTTITQAKALTFLRSAVGKPYILGRNGPQAFDCSGLYYWFLKQCKFPTIDRTAASFFNVTYAVKTPQFGDTVYLRGSYVYHMAVIGERLDNGDYAVYEAKGRRYGVVKTTLSYWRKRPGFAGIRRMKGIEYTMGKKLYSGKKTNTINLAPGKWTNIDVDLPFTDQDIAMVYARLRYTLADASQDGYAEIRMVRGNGDPTAYDGIYLPRKGASVPVTRFWRGANATGKVRWQIRLMHNVKAGHITTRYAKGFTS